MGGGRRNRAEPPKRWVRALVALVALGVGVSGVSCLIRGRLVTEASSSKVSRRGSSASSSRGLRQSRWHGHSTLGGGSSSADLLGSVPVHGSK
jgi:hypothetical protein